MWAGRTVVLNQFVTSYIPTPGGQKGFLIGYAFCTVSYIFASFIYSNYTLKKVSSG